MQKEKGITLIKLVLIIIGIIIVIYILGVKLLPKTMITIKWDDIPSVEYYELRLAATTSEVNGYGSGTLSLASFNTLGKAVKKAKGKWFKDSNVNFSTFILDDNSGEGVSLTDGEHVAIFIFIDDNDYVSYMFLDKNNDDNKKFIDKIFDKDLFGGYRITIK